jgi:hypothetical protein
MTPNNMQTTTAAVNTTGAPRIEAHLTPELRRLLATLIARETVLENEVEKVFNLAALCESGLLLYPSPVLGRLLGELPELFETHVLPLLDFDDRTSIALPSRRCRDLVRRCCK